MTITTIQSRGSAAVARMSQANIDYENLAGQQELDQRVLRYVDVIMAQHTDVVAPLHQRWSVTNHMLSGNTIDRAGPIDVHIPELYKMIETMVPRIEEALLETHDPWFYVSARHQEDDGLANANAALLDYQLAQMRHRQTVQPGLRDYLVTQIVVEKIWWEDCVEERVDRKVTREIASDGKTVTYRIDRKLQQKLVYSGPKGRLVDPFDFIIDPKATDPQNAEYVGDRSYMTYDRLLELQEQGVLKNVEKLRKNASPRGSLSPQLDFYKWSRSPISFNQEDPVLRDRRGAGQPELYEVIDLYGKYDLFGDGNYVESVITVADGRVVLRAMQNPYDLRHRPYATGRCARNAHDFWGNGPLDNAVRLNQYLDRYHSIFMRTAEVAAGPMMIVEDDSELPDSLWKVQPFSIFKATGRVTMTDVPDAALSAGPTILTSLTRQIEETVGVFKIEMGQQFSTGTATEASLSLQEGNRRMRGIIRGYADYLEQKLRIMHNLNLQFLSEPVAFRVLGKRSQELHELFLHFTPDMMIEDVDFRFIGLDQLSTFGMRASSLERILAVAAPLIVGNPNRVDQVGILHTLFEVLVGQNEADRYIRPMTNPKDRMSQEEENLMLLQGLRVHVDQDDPHDMHLAAIRPLVDKAASGELKDNIAMVVLNHAMHHLQYQQRQQQEEAIRERDAIQRRMVSSPEAGGMQAPPNVGGLEAGLGGLPAIGGQNAGELPGPGLGPQHATVGRQQANTLPQTVNQPVR